MKHSTRLLVMFAAVIAALGLAATGWAYWTASGSGSASAAVGTLNAPTNVTVPAGPVASPVAVSWTAPTGGVAPTGYYVQRFAGSTLDGSACGSSPAGLLPATPTSCNDSNVVDGTYTYRVTAVFASWAGVSAPSSSVTVSNIGPASQIVLSGSTADLASGSTRLLTATIQDAAGHTVISGADSTHAVTFLQSSGTGSVSGVGAANATNGVATITVTGNLAGPVTTQAAATFTGGAASSNTLSFNVVAGTASQIALSGSTTDLASGVTRVLTATIKDAAGNTVTTGDDATRSVTFTQTGGTGSVGGIAGGTPATAGVATITVTGYAAGSVTTQASATLTAGLTQSNALSFNVTVGAATQLAFTQQPGNSTGGVSLPTQPKVTVQDFGGNTVSTDNGSVAVAMGTNPGGGSLAGTTTVNAVNGIASFSGLSIDKAGSGYTLTASRSGLNAGTSASFNITVGAAVKLAFNTSPSNSTGGTAFATQPKVTVQDAGGNTVTTDASTVNLTITTGTPTSGGPGTLSGCTQTETAGVVSFAGCKIDTIGTGYKLHATDGTLTAADSATFNVTVGAAAKLAFTTSPSNATGGVTFTNQPIVAVQDAGGNTVSTDNGSVAVAMGTNPGGGSLAGTTTVNAVNGIASFSGLSIDKAGSGYTLTASRSGLNAGTSASFNITVGAAVKLAFTTSPSNSTGGTAFATQPKVTVQDAGGNTVTTDASTVNLTITTGTPTSGGPGTLSGCTQTETAGVVSFAGCKIDTIGTGYKLHATDGTLTAADSATFNVTVGAAAKLAFTTSPSNATGGVTFTNQPIVAVQDAGGNTVSTDNGSVAVAMGTNPGGGSLAGTTTVNAVNGIASFSGLSIDKAGSGYTLTASRSGLNAGTSASFNITVGAAVKLAFTTSPSNSTGGTAFATQPKVTVQDAGGNTVTTDASTVNLTITTGTPTSGGPGTLSGCTQTETAGVVSFAGCKIDTIGTGYKLHATDGTLTAADSATFNVYGNVAGLIFSNVKVNNATATPTCTGTIGSTWACTVTGTANNATITANVAFANSSGTATVYSSQAQSISWTATGKFTPNSGTVSVAGGQTTSGAVVTAQRNGSNSAAVTVTFTNWNGQTWTAVLNAS